ncbi:tetratricopeptide repeat protein [Legionella sp. W05-934-2]|uniref:tetratricopeptide repeat protein n=1 Tax=Legionella sp. W05-934-2 TaxID=1198649 RepID=UPI0034619C39
MTTFTPDNKALQKLQSKLNQAVDNLNAKQFDKARNICRNITKSNPKLAVGWHILAIIEKQSGQLKSALYAFDKAIQLDSTNPHFIYNLAVTFHEAGMVEQAIQSYEKSLQLNPNNAAALDNLGTLLQQKMALNEALAMHLKAVSLQPTPNGYNNLGECYRKLNQAELAIESYQNAIQMMPNYPGALKNLGNLYKEIGAFDKASEYLQKAVAAENSIVIDQSGLDAQWNQASLFLLQGRYEEGWSKYDFGIQQGTRTFVDYGYPVWQGNNPEQQSILIIGEQGIGDEIMFSSCFADALDSFKQVFIECDPRLVPMFERTFANATVIARGNAPAFAQLKENNQIDCQLPAGSLPRYYRQHQDSFPKQSRYLFSDKQSIKYWQEKLSALGNELKIGIAWRGGRTPMIIQKRSTPLSLWQSLLQTHSTQFINLQYGDCQPDIDWVSKHLGVTIHNFSEIDPLKDMDNYAALIENLDLVISIDNSVVHLAGALGKSTWVLLPYIPDWRWQMDSKTSVWYSSLRLFRQSDRDDWGPVFSEVEQCLSQVLKKTVPIEKENQSHSKRALLLNDTSSWYHWGCTCTSNAILKHLLDRGYHTDSVPIQDSLAIVYSPNTLDDVQSADFQTKFIKQNAVIIDKIRTCDVVVLNGEGSLHGSSSPVLTQLLLVKLAKERFGKETHIINHSCYPDDSSQITDTPICNLYQSIYTSMDSVAIREPISTALMRKLGIDATQSFDCLPLYLQQHQIIPSQERQPYIVLSGSVILRDDHIDQFVNLMPELKERGLNIIVLTGAKAHPAREDIYLIDKLKQKGDVSWQWVDAKSAKEWLRVIGEAQLLLSGRFHHSIAAAFLKTPFIALNSNTPKMNGMLEMLQLPEPISMETEHLSEQLIKIIDKVMQNPNQWIAKDDVLESLTQLAKNNFAGIKVVA